MISTHFDATRSRLAVLLSPALAVLLGLSVAGCGGGEDPTPDAPPAGPVNALGAACTSAAECPSDPAHTCVFLTVGDPNLGYCSPVCAGNEDCTNGYLGPVTGVISCFTPNDPAACSIECTGPADCPDPLECVATGGPFSFCANPPPQ